MTTDKPKTGRELGVELCSFMLQPHPPLQAVEDFINRGADLSAQDEQGNTVLHWCAHFHPELIAYFISQNAPRETRNHEGKTALACAMDVQAITALIAGGCATANIDGKGNALLHDLCARNEVVFLEAALKLENKSVNTRNGEDMTPLLTAAHNLNIDCIPALLNNGANPIVRDKDGQTARTLIEKSDIFLINEYGDTAFAAACDLLKQSEIAHNKHAVAAALLQSPQRPMPRPAVVMRRVPR